MPRTTPSLPSSRPPLLRMVKVHELISAGSYPNCRNLAKNLEVSPKTIQRDVDFMRDQLQLPIEYDTGKFGYHYTRPVSHFPTMEVSEGEIVALYVAQMALNQYRGTSFEKPLQRAFSRLSESLTEKVAFHWSEMDASVSFRGLGTTIADLELFEVVSNAVLHSYELHFDYQKIGSQTHEPRRVHPYHLSCIDQQWYLFAFDLERKQLRTFVLPRMRNARKMRSRFQRPNFSISDHLSESFGVFSKKGGGSYKVRIQFDAFAARLVGERQWHATQKFKPLADGRAELSLELGSLEEIERWILSWGAHAKVLAPAELCDRVRATALAIANGSEGGAPGASAT